VVRDDSVFPDSLLTDNGASPYHIQSQTSSSVALLPTAILDSSSVDELNLLPVCGAEINLLKSDGFTSGPIEPSQMCSDKDNLAEENARKNDDVTINRVTENNDAGVCEVQVVKGALGLGFCIEGGKGSVAGDLPIAVKRFLRGIVYFYWFISQRVAITSI